MNLKREHEEKKVSIKHRKSRIDQAKSKCPHHDETEDTAGVIISKNFFDRATEIIGDISVRIELQRYVNKRVNGNHGSKEEKKAVDGLKSEDGSNGAAGESRDVVDKGETGSVGGNVVTKSDGHVRSRLLLLFLG